MTRCPRAAPLHASKSPLGGGFFLPSSSPEAEHSPWLAEGHRQNSARRRNRRCIRRVLPSDQRDSSLPLDRHAPGAPA
jgi:hypothetical protein